MESVSIVTEGWGSGAVTTDDAELTQRMRMFRNHGITMDFRQREKAGGWFYEMVALGYNYRLTDIQCALGLSQLKRLKEFKARRQELVKEYNKAFRHGLGPCDRAQDH